MYVCVCVNLYKILSCIITGTVESNATIYYYESDDF